MERIEYNRIQGVLDEKGKTVYWLQEQLGETIPNVVHGCGNVGNHRDRYVRMIPRNDALSGEKAMYLLNLCS